MLENFVKRLPMDHPEIFAIAFGLVGYGILWVIYDTLVTAPHRRRERMMQLAVEGSANELEKARIEAERVKLDASKASQKQ